MLKLYLVILMILSSCTNSKPHELKSPCVSADIGEGRAPCEKRKPTDNWLL